jgi:hypothetical protein
MRTNTFSPLNTRVDFGVSHELAKIRAHQLRREAIDRFWALAFDWASARMGRISAGAKPLLSVGVH